MKTRVVITEVNHEDIVNLFQFVATSWIGVFYDTALLEQHGNKTQCFEDNIANTLLNGDTIQIGDYNAEESDEFYGMLPHEHNEAAMWYTVGIEDIIKGLNKAYRGTDYQREAVTNLNYSPEDLDEFQCTELLQIIMFGEVIYG